MTICLFSTRTPDSTAFYDITRICLWRCPVHLLQVPQLTESHPERPKTSRSRKFYLSCGSLRVRCNAMGYSMCPKGGSRFLKTINSRARRRIPGCSSAAACIVKYVVSPPLRYLYVCTPVCVVTEGQAHSTRALTHARYIQLLERGRGTFDIVLSLSSQVLTSNFHPSMIPVNMM
ncbi:hypothetical protein BDY19DRAFT_202737 [Irpex rosettiformis]|uniref:Uncharacterized protein n=1 Tax=Irpex rosettiformis TaxID=378272 RepID=A0ACB8U173_9APHY|nr:hypothetical protein BDY19DRAFT_202737 [Irpex rosettiformis]